MTPQELQLAQAALRKLAPPQPVSKPKWQPAPPRRLSRGVYEFPHGFSVRFTRRINGRPRGIYLGTFKTEAEATAVAAQFIRNNPPNRLRMPWSEEDRETLRRMAGKVPSRQIAEKLGRSMDAVSHVARKLGVSLLR